MNQDKKEQIVRRSIPDLENLYTLAWHQGRQEERYKLSECGFLIIDPEKKKELEKIAYTDSCDSCEHYMPEYRMNGMSDSRYCSVDSSKCEKKQKRTLALELLSFFK